MSWIDVGASVFVSALSIRFLVILWAAGTFFAAARFLMNARSSFANRRFISSRRSQISRRCFWSHRLTASYFMTPWPSASG